MFLTQVSDSLQAGIHNNIVNFGVIGTTLAASAIMGLIKKVTPVDNSIIKAIKPLQPLIVPALGVLLAIGGNAVHFNITSDDAAAVSAAPLSGIIAITMREVLAKLSNKFIM